MTPRVAVVVTSFNRPRLLDACLRSIALARPDEVFVCDDGSDLEGFNVAVTVGRALYQRTHYSIVSNPPIGVDARMTTPRQGALINRALTYVTGEITTLCCDDDVLHPGWLDALRAHWAEFPQRELARGTWLQFEDGDTPSEDDPACPLDIRGMTAGNFAWHSSLHRDRGVRWPEDALNCLDNGFLENCQRAGVSQLRVPCVGRAGWRREHPLANGNFATGTGHHTPAFRAVLESGKLEPEIAR